MSRTIVSKFRNTNFIDKQRLQVYMTDMNENKIKKLSHYYQEDIDKIAAHQIWEKVTVRGLNLSRKTIQRAYKEMKKENFRGDIIDYLCYICLREIIDSACVAYKAKANIRAILNFLLVYLILYRSQIISVCRLMLKDESYLDEAFEKHGINKKDKVYIGIKERLLDLTDQYLSRKSNQPNNIKKLKPN